MAAEKKITSRIQQKHDVAANWAKATNFIPKKGEIIIYDAEYNAGGEETQAVRFKIGDGSKTVNNLPFAAIDYSSDIEALKRKVANNSTAIGALQENTVPKTRKINNKALSSDITLGAADVGVNETTFPGLKKTGTVTGVKMNGTTKNPSSGVVDLGTVLTEHQSIKSINTNNTAAQEPKTDESIAGSGTINLHKIAKTGNYNDLLHKPTLGTAAEKNIGTSSGNVPILDSNGKLADSVIPAVAITDTYVIDTEEEMLALSAQKGDIAIRSDLNKSYVLQTTPASTLANWKELLTPTDTVLSVNGQTGTVELTASDVKALPSSTKYAASSEVGGAATSANKVNSNLIVKLNSGATEGTNLFTFNGSAAKTINITPSAIGAAASSHGTHVTADTVKSALGTGSGTSKYLREDGTWQIPPNTHYTNYLQIKGNNTEAVKFTQDADKTLNFKPGANVSISAASGEITISSTDTNTATAADNILDGSNSGTEITYKPYTSQQSKLSFDTSTTNPTRTDRLNLNGYLYATKLYSGGKEVFTSHQSIKSINTNNTAAQIANVSEAIAGSGTINLHKVSKTGNYNDLLNKLTAGSNITISEENIISAKDTTYTFTANNPTLAWNTTSKIGTIGGVEFNITMPANPDTDTGATSVEVTGAGNAVTAASYNASTRKLTLTKGATFLTSHQDISGLMPKSGGTFTGAVKFGNTENFQGYYIKRMIGSLGAGTAYNNLDSSYKDGTWHRMWRLRFPNGSSFWGKIKITLYGGYSSFNASGVMSKSITCNFNTSNIYNNVGCYDGLGVNVEQDFRISEAIWNADVSAWEVLIWQKNLKGNNSPTIMLECWTTNNTKYINAFNGITAQPVELTQSTSYSAQRASSTGGTKTVTWATLPVYENPLGEEIATVSGLATVATSGSYNDLSNKPTFSFSNGVLTITT